MKICTADEDLNKVHFWTSKNFEKNFDNIAGSITTSWSLRTLVAVLVNNPHIQRALQEEADHVMGDDLPRIKYRQHMPYTEAVSLVHT